MPPRTPITPVMAGINAALNMFRTPQTPTSGKVGLPTDEDEPLVGGEGLASEKCELRIEGMTCGACVEVCFLHILWDMFSEARMHQSIEGMLRSQPGIHSIKVALLAERGVVDYDPKLWDADKIISVSAPSFLSSRNTFVSLPLSAFLSPIATADVLSRLR